MKKLIILVIAIVIIIIVILGSSSSSPTATGPIRLAAIISETGFAAAFGEMSHKGIQLAVDEINAAGGIDGRMVEIVWENDQTDPKVSSGLFQKVTAIDKVDAIIGSNFDFVTQPLFSLAATNKVVVVSPSNPRIPGTFDTNSHAFVMMTEFDTIIRSLEGYLGKESYTQLGIVRFESAFAESIMNTLDTMQKELGKKPIISETYKQIGNNDFKTQILKLKQAKVDLVFLDMIGPDPVTFVQQARALGFTPRYLTHIGIQDALSIQGVEPTLFDGFIVLNWNYSPASFNDKFQKVYGIAADKSADRAYDAVYVLAQAVAQNPAGTDLAVTLEKGSFVTPNTTFKFNAQHAADMTPVMVQTIKGGKIVPYMVE